ncbi:hypothetical protein GALL_171890 [mine drainage metagenome]|uniref:Outer membrane protein beta-barrel domain-containing protein n=1 Tax=mine drainage metagenome TaxID=410659 RepID=A0A1J5S9D1_9ZZZZ
MSYFQIKLQTASDGSPPLAFSNFKPIQIIYMKKTILLIITASFIFCNANSQITEGTWMVGGTGQIYSYNQDFSTSTYSVQYKYVNIDISSSVGFFVADKLALGLRPNLTWLKGHSVSSTGGVGGLSTDTKRYSIGPFVRYYLLQEEKPYNILVDASYLFGSADFFQQSNGKINTFSIAVGPEIYFNSSVGLEFLLGYTAKTEEIPNNYKDVRNGFQVSIGFQFHLEK